MGKKYDLLIQARGETRDAEIAMKRLQKQVKGFGKSMRKVGTGLTAAVTLPVAAMAAVGIRELSEMQTVNAQTFAALKSTGNAAKLTSSQIQRLAQNLSKLSGIDDQVIQGGENILLTFNKISGADGTFARATKAALDLSVAFGKDMASSSVMVGKALQDPIKGVTALTRVGVSFTQAQKDQIKALVETGKTAQAQKLILKELETQVGGSAAAYGQTAAGAVGRLKEQFAGLSAQMITNLLPAFTTIGNGLQRAMTWFDGLSASTKKWVGIGLLVGAAIGPILIGVGQLTMALSALIPVMLAVTAPMLAIGAAVVALGAATAALVIHERNKQNEFRKTAQNALQLVAAMRSLKDMQDAVAGARLTTKESALAAERAEVTYRQAVARGGRGSLEAREALVQLQRARLSHTEAVKAEKAELAKARSESAKNIQVVHQAAQALRDEVTVRRALGEAQKGYANATTAAERASYAAQITNLSAHLKKQERAHATNQKIVSDALRKGAVTRQELMAREAQHLQQQAGAAGTAAGRAMGTNFTSSFRTALGSVGTVISNLEERVRELAAANEGGSTRSGKGRKGGARPPKSGISVLGDLFGPSVNSSQIMRYVGLDGAQAYSTKSNEDGTSTVNRNEGVIAFLEARKKANEALLAKRLRQRTGVLKKAQGARKDWMSAKRARVSTPTGREAKARRVAAAFQNLLDLVSALDSLDAEILALGGAIESDADSLVAPEADTTENETSSGSDSAAASTETASDASSIAAQLASTQANLAASNAAFGVFSGPGDIGTGLGGSAFGSARMGSPTIIFQSTVPYTADQARTVAGMAAQGFGLDGTQQRVASNPTSSIGA